MLTETRKEIESLLTDAAGCEEWAALKADQADNAEIQAVNLRRESDDSVERARQYRNEAKAMAGPVTPFVPHVLSTFDPAEEDDYAD